MFLLGFSSKAEAALVFCNRTQNPLEAALGHRETEAQQETDIWLSEGWWRIDPGQCARVYGEPLMQRFYYYYATSLVRSGKDKAPFTWVGKYQFCTDTKAFKIEGDNDCEAKNYQIRGFQQIDIGANTRDYTLDFRDGTDEK